MVLFAGKSSLSDYMALEPGRLHLILGMKPASYNHNIKKGPHEKAPE
jgi:hypothetical protein